jgi:outer membrane protein assembly factor BamB
MTLSTQRPPWRRLTLWAALVLVAVFAALAALVYFRDAAYRDAARLHELQSAPLPQVKASTTDWPQWRGPNRDGVSAETGLLTTWPDDLLTRRKVWQQPVGLGFSALAVTGGRAYTMMQDGDHEVVVCWHADTGKELWRFRYPARYTGGQGEGPRSTPTVAGDRVYTVGATGIMHCLKTHPSSQGGEVVWKKDLLQDFGARMPQWGVSFSPLVEGDSVYVSPGGPDGRSVAALATRDGSVRWQNLDDPQGYSSPVAATLAGKPQVLFFTAAGAVGVSPKDGTLYWRFPWKTSFDVNAATPIVVGNYVFITSGYGVGCVLLKIEAAGNSLEARPVYGNKSLRGQFSSPVRYLDHLYGFDDTVLTCLDLRTGERCWKHKGFRRGSLLIADGHLLILGEYGPLALAEATPKEYRETASVRTPQRLSWTMPVLANGRLYLRDQERVLCLDLRAKQP